MCGIAFLISPPPIEAARAAMRGMLRAIEHRGPDDEGIWSDDELGVILGHRRLSILDVSDRGHQPMTSQSGRYVVAFNGEIYNYREIRADLERDPPTGELSFQGGSDTEVLLAAVERWGLEVALEKFVGMFAFVLWDRQEREFSLVRDRLGKKPLYYGVISGRLIVASEISAFRAAAGALRVDHDAMAQLARFTFIPEPYSAYQDVKKLRPGTFLRLRLERFRDAASEEPTTYYRLENAISQGAPWRRKAWTEEEVLQLIETELERAVQQRLRTDVPFGAFLSGGIDSSLVVALMTQSVDTKVRTFALGFDDKRFNEAEHAKEVARHLGTDHQELIVSEGDVLDLVPEMVKVYDEPFADSSQLPTTLVARLARREVTVVLTGDGGDEVFAGYNRHVWGERVWKGLSVCPPAFRKRFGAAVLGLSSERWDELAARVMPLVPSSLRINQPGEKMRKLGRLSRCRTPEEMHLDLATAWLPEEEVTRLGRVVRTLAEKGSPQLEGLSPLERALWFDTLQGLPGDMLVKVDRATMSVGLEARQPLLDHRLLEASWRLPPSFKIRHGVGKWPLRQILAKHVPRALWERPKTGFSVPIDAWLRGPLRTWAEELLSERKLDEHGVFRKEPVRRAWARHLANGENHGARLWTVLSAQAWLDHEVDRANVSPSA